MGKQDTKASKGGATDPKEAEIRKYTEVIEELSKKAPAKVAPHVKWAAPYLATALVYFLIALPYITKALGALQEFVAGLPEKVIYASLGFAVCFFGGIFPATIAAVEAWRLCGGTEALTCLRMLKEEWLKVQAASREDDAKASPSSKDKGKGGADANPFDAQELIARKAQVVLRSVEPETISHGVVGLYTGWIGVLAILKIKFAKTVTLGERIGEEIYRYVARFEPAIAASVPEEYRKWVPVGVRWACKLSAVSVAWWISRAISAVHSAIRGGLVFGRYLVDFLHERKIINFQSDQAYLDEAIAFGVAAAGLLFQYSLGFGLPFPLSLFLWPVQLLEAFIVWSVAAV